MLCVNGVIGKIEVCNIGEKKVLNIAICDDEKAFCQKLENILNEILEQEKITADIDVYQNGNELLGELEKSEIRYDIILLDIEMEGMDGLETAKKLREKDEITILIYVTSYTSYAIEAFEVQPFRFVLKPVDKNVIHTCFMKAYEKIITEKFYFHFKYQRDYYKVLVSDILYFESEKRIIWIHLKDGVVRKVYDKLNNIEKHMKKGRVEFYRIHKSFLVNSQYIIRKAYNHVELADGTLLDISEDRRKQMNEYYMKEIEGDMFG